LNVNEEIDKLLNDFTEKWAKDLEVSLFDALKKGGRGNPNPPDIRFKGGVVYGVNKVNINVYADKDYWYYIENGRKKGKQPPTKVVGEKWQAKNGINPANIVYQMTVDYNQKKGFTKRKVKKLPFKKAAKQFAFIVARSIGKKGIKAKPFRNTVVNDGRLTEFTDALLKLIGKEITVKENILR
jgi:hypothetical protein